jgi:16S rRNA processing protein RimM
VQPRWDDMPVVGRVARPHGLRGQVVINPETDFPAERFQTGTRLFFQREGRVTALVVASARFHLGRPIIGFEGCDAIEDVVSFAGLELRVPDEDLQPLPHGAYYRHQLVGCQVRTLRGEVVGAVTAVDGTFTGSRLVVPTSRGEVLVPLAAEICVAIDLTARLIVIDPPDGLLDLNTR